jgi:hypothetical protein
LNPSQQLPTSQQPPVSSSQQSTKPADLEAESSFQVNSNIDKITKDFIDQSQLALNRLITAKVELHKNKNALEDQVDSLKERQGICEANIGIVQGENQRIEKFIKENSERQTKEVTEDNIDEFVYPLDDYSNK